MNKLFLIGIGSGLGGICRYLVTTGVHKIVNRDFPYGTLTVNAIGAFLIGFIFILLLNRFMGATDQLRSLLIIGFLGGFTTFSAFSIETIVLMEKGEFVLSLLNILLSVAICLTLTWLGKLLAR